ncbi:hypothetical protein [Kocuria marina]|uniref:hypothetical protein n=1 Tax=Kocuria marina TaxID=223184 RepID=UPI0021B4D9D3|nr:MULTISPECIES: hypothetical protein [Kocuria]MCT2020985.1 hypothetical protein [Kocuria marina]
MFARARVVRRLQRGRAASSSGDTATARDHYAAALRAARLGEAWLEAGQAASSLADLARDAGDWADAEHHYRLAATQYKRAPWSARSVGARVQCLENLGDVLLLAGRPWDAYREFQEGAAAAGVDPARPAGDGAGFVTREDLRWTSHLATAAQAAGRRKLATEHYETVLAGCEARGDVAGQIMCWKGLAALAEGMMAWNDVAHALHTASNLYPALPEPEAHTREWVQCLRDVGAVYKTLGRRDEQVRAFKLALRLEQVDASARTDRDAGQRTSETMAHDEHRDD